MDEFTLIRRYFAARSPHRDDVLLGIGDDGALVKTSAEGLVVVADMLVEGVHFPVDTAADAIGHKALAVNLSDLGAMGAEPTWFTLMISLPESSADWLEGFSRGLFDLATRFGVALIGGDTVRGPLTVAIQAAGTVPVDKVLKRSGARVGDIIMVTGALGGAALGLAQRQGRLSLEHSAADAVLKRLEFPEPRVEAGRLLRGLASSVIDISDGLLADLGHILEASEVGASIRLDAVPADGVFSLPLDDQARDAVLAHGDDYELCFTAPPDAVVSIQKSLAAIDVEVSAIGQIEALPGLRVLDAAGRELALGAHAGHTHFASNEQT